MRRLAAMNEPRTARAQTTRAPAPGSQSRAASRQHSRVRTAVAAACARLPVSQPPRRPPAGSSALRAKAKGSAGPDGFAEGHQRALSWTRVPLPAPAGLDRSPDRSTVSYRHEMGRNDQRQGDVPCGVERDHAMRATSDTSAQIVKLAPSPAFQRHAPTPNRIGPHRRCSARDAVNAEEALNYANPSRLSATRPSRLPIIDHLLIVQVRRVSP